MLWFALTWENLLESSQVKSILLKLTRILQIKMIIYNWPACISIKETLHTVKKN